MSCLTAKNGRTLERESSVHAARVLWCVMTWESTSMLLLHTYDVVHRLRQATIVARRTNAASCLQQDLRRTDDKKENSSTIPQQQKNSIQEEEDKEDCPICQDALPKLSSQFVRLACCGKGLQSKIALQLCVCTI